jgi:hypothetical protein
MTDPASDPNPLPVSTQQSGEAGVPQHEEFDVWLKRAFHQSFDAALSMPTPSTLLDLASQPPVSCRRRRARQ